MLLTIAAHLLEQMIADFSASRTCPGDAGLPCVFAGTAAGSPHDDDLVRACVRVYAIISVFSAVLVVIYINSIVLLPVVCVCVCMYVYVWLP